LGDYIHAKGLKFGIYGDRGTMTCMGIPQSGGHNNEVKDANTYASWTVDYLKYDNCNADSDIQADYERMRDALLNCGRPICFSICSWSYNGDWMINCGNLWRTTGDVSVNNTVSWTEIGLMTGNATVRDLWAKVDRGTFSNSYTVNVPSHGTAMLKIVGTVAPTPTPSPSPTAKPGVNYLSDMGWTYSANGYGPVEKDKSNGENAAGDGKTITLNSTTYTKVLDATRLPKSGIIWEVSIQALCPMLVWTTKWEPTVLLPSKCGLTV
jgi:hypothetical protein